MSTRQTIGISILSNLLTLVVVIILLVSSGTILSQNPERPIDPAFPDSTVSDSSVTVPTREAQGAEAEEVYLHIAGSTFIPMYWDTKPVYDYGGCTYGDTTASPGRVIYNLPVILPPGSTINSLRFYYKDSSVNNSTLRLRGMADGQGIIDIAQVSSEGDAGYNNNTVTLNYLVDYENYNYVLQWYANVVGSGMELCGVRIGYTPPSIFGVALPFVIKDQQP